MKLLMFQSWIDLYILVQWEQELHRLKILFHKYEIRFKKQSKEYILLQAAWNMEEYGV